MYFCVYCAKTITHPVALIALLCMLSDKLWAVHDAFWSHRAFRDDTNGPQGNITTS